MISYELAKELKNAGFPQKTVLGDISCEVCKGLILSNEPSTSWDDESFIYSRHKECPTIPHELTRYSPTLSELIEVCGDKFNGLWVGAKDWYADSINPAQKIGRGSTPEEAVARLWLGLNEKNG